MFGEIFKSFLKYGFGFYALFLGVGIIMGEPIDTITLSDGTVENGLVLKGAVIVFVLVLIASVVISGFGSLVERYESRSSTNEGPSQPTEDPTEYVEAEIVEDEPDELPALSEKNTWRGFFLTSGKSKKDNGQ